MFKKGGIRFWVTAMASTVVGLLLIVAGVALVVLVRSGYVSNIDRTLAQRADDIASFRQEGFDLLSLGSDRDRPEGLSSRAGEGFVQLVDAQGRVISTSQNIRGTAAFDISTGGGGDTIRNVSLATVDDTVSRVLTRPLEGGALHVGTSFDGVVESTRRLAGALVVIIPISVAALASLIWWLVGRTLDPVQAITSEVASITSSDLERRVPETGTEDEIDHLANTMNQMLDRLSSSIERERRFVADVSHELRSPLTRLRTELEVEILSSEDLAEKDRLGSLHEEVVGLQEIVEDLLYLARADAGESHPRSGPVDLDDLVLHEGSLLMQNGRVEVDLSEVSGAQVHGDRDDLARAIKNVVDNAGHHASTRVVIGLKETDGRAVMTVGDDGVGIPRSDAKHIFDRFSRLDESRTPNKGGAGLGLAIARDIVTRHGGTLHLTNPGAPGAIFEIRLPLDPN
ncbi:MAG: HAMP domain-containing protein [Acidimicrobiia bacterium]|nr:HAMP domain-containing protein [Acidimicrobiia bacterium]